jgi:hypothetical protein
MSLNLTNLDADTRKFMLQEIQHDVDQGKLYISPRLSSQGAQDYRNLLLRAATDGNDTSLAGDLRAPGRMNTTEERRKPKGGFTTAQVPVTAPDTLAEGEFNRFYARGLCLRAQRDGIGTLTVYRAKQVANPRSESEALLGSQLPVQQLLQDLRQHTGTDTALGLPPGPNSGLSVRLP